MKQRLPTPALSPPSRAEADPVICSRTATAGEGPSDVARETNSRSATPFLNGDSANGGLSVSLSFSERERAGVRVFLDRIV